ncbi:Uncharacterised protein [Mycobacteroides abscessus subsp. abscessus]|nr:Uncharacterised protein [Mycobacteroides abscessus subsp. abscessus]
MTEGNVVLSVNDHGKGTSLTRCGIALRSR